MRAYRLAYDGTGYRGFQRQPHGETVEDALFGALRDLDVAFEDGSPAGYTAAGRTDAGVSARAQTVAFEAPKRLRPRAFDAELPACVRVWAVAADFHATRDAAARTYRYFLYAPDAADDLAEAACERLTGRQDFQDFTPDEDGTVRDVAIDVVRDGPFLVVDVRAGGFPRQLVRRLVSAVEAVARGRREPAFLDRALGPTPLEGPEGIAPAAPEPLVLADVAYPSVSFEVDEPAAAGRRDPGGRPEGGRRLSER
ncbi:tRNA pseudouridine(38-40) synthase TruA [Halobacteriales archaeon QS_1_69_70]|nr:MAG: tRNA pseudouridine(38-40) synthase TruA [Halobacteriales archaeon QS_1_69_70]